MKKSLLVLSAFAMLVTFSNCKKSSPGPSSNAMVMFVNACAGTTSVDVKNGTTNVAGATGLGYLSHTGYINVVAGSPALTFYINGLGTPLIGGTVALTANTGYSVFAGGIVTAPVFVATSDNLTAPGASDAKIRFVNLSSDNLNESCYIGTQKLDSNVAYPSITPFVTTPAGTGITVLMSDPANPTKIAQLTNQTFSAGKIYTIVATGTYAGTGVSALKLTVIGNN